MKTTERLLVRGSNWLGDAVMTMPALCRLREAYPAAHIAVLTLPKLADIYAYQPAIDAVLTLTREETMLAMAARLRAERFDTALIFTNSVRTALPLWLAGIPRRFGYAGRGRTLLLTHPVPRGADVVRLPRRSYVEIRRLTAPDSLLESSMNRAGKRALIPFVRSPLTPAASHTHHLYHYLQLVSALGAQPIPSAPVLVVPDGDAQALRDRFGLPTVADPSNRCRPLFGLTPGAEYGLAKRWPEERFVAAAVELHRRIGCRWIILGGPADRELASRIATAIQAEAALLTGHIEKGQIVWNLAGQTSLRELCAALRVCDLVLTNDTGPMHVAAAVGTPVVVPFGSTSPELTGPGLPGMSPHRLLRSPAACAPCFQRVCPIDFRCMNGISVSHVVEAMMQLWEQRA